MAFGILETEMKFGGAPQSGSTSISSSLLP